MSSGHACVGWFLITFTEVKRLVQLCLIWIVSWTKKGTENEHVLILLCFLIIGVPSIINYLELSDNLQTFSLSCFCQVIVSQEQEGKAKTAFLTYSQWPKCATQAAGPKSSTTSPHTPTRKGPRNLGTSDAECNTLIGWNSSIWSQKPVHKHYSLIYSYCTWH